MILMMLLWPLLIAGGIFLILWIINPKPEKPSSITVGTGPMEAVKQRYARGEIDKIEFETRIQAIKGTH